MSENTTEDETRYIKNDLGDYATTPTTEPDGYSRTDYLQAILPGEANIEVYSTGGYQGTMGYVITLDGYYWLIKEAFGSCSYCDGFIDSNKVEYSKSMCRNAYCFDDSDEAMKFLTEMAEGSAWGWERIASEMTDFVQQMEI